MLATLANKLRWSYRKNWPDVRGILARDYPAFVFDAKPSSLDGQLPVFVYHSVTPELFESHLRYLQDNDYRTLGSADLLSVINGGMPLPDKAAVLTFDDGTASFRSVAWPLLRKYDMRAICFLIPGCIPEEAPKMPEWQEYETGRISSAALMAREQSNTPLCSWQEIEHMHASGHVDFEAHSMYHHLVQVSPQLVDFIHPGYDFYFYANIHVPVYHSSGKPDYSRQVELGTPVYRSEPRLAGRPQYFDNESVRAECIEFVQSGPKKRFSDRNWRSKLRQIHRNATARHGEGSFESDSALREGLLWDFQSCRDTLKQRLKGASVQHFCFPWFIGSDIAVEAAQSAGFSALHWGVLPGRRCNHAGSDALRIVRIEERFLPLLPGKNRHSLTQVLSSKITQNLPIFRKRLASAIT